MAVYLARINSNRTGGEMGAAVSYKTVSFATNGRLIGTRQPSNQEFINELKRIGWGVTAFNAKKTALGVFLITLSVRIGSNDNPNRVAQSLTNYLSAYFTGINVRTLAEIAGDKTTVAQFSYKVTHKGGLTSEDAFKRVHDRFNASVSANFPKLMYGGAFTAYTTPFYGSSLFGKAEYAANGETKLSESETKNLLNWLLTDAASGILANGFDFSTVQFSYRTIGDLQNGSNIEPPKWNTPAVVKVQEMPNAAISTVGSFADTITDNLPQMPKSIFDSFAKGLGISTPIMAVIVIGTFILIMKN